MDFSIQSLSKRIAPPEGVELLLKAIASDDQAALDSWRRWRAGSTIPAARGAERRLLPAVCERLENLAIDPADKLALSSLRRITWQENRVRLHGNLWVLRRLADAGIPMMLLKGGARFASQPQAMSCRVVRDLDILFPADRLVDAIELLIESRLRSVNGRLPGVIKSLPFTPLRPAGPRPADFMEIDVHAAPLRLGQNGDFDAAVWRRAVPAALLGVPVFVPSASDRFLQAVAHGLVADDDRPFDWVVDALVALRHPDFDADVAASEIRGRCLGVPLAMGCSVIEDRLGVAVPREILLACKPQIGSLLFRAEMEATLSVSRKRSLVQRTVIGAAEWVRSSGAARRAATWNTAWLFKPSLRHSVDGASTFALGRATVPLASGARVRQGRLIVYLTLPDEMLMRRSFDLLIDDVWIGRVRLRATGALKRLPHRSWRAIVRYRLPRAFVGPGPSVLTVVSLDDRKFPSDQPLEGVAVTASIGRLRV